MYFIFQTMVSYVQRSLLGSKLDPENSLLPYKKELYQFSDVMEKLQTLIEEEKNATSTITATMLPIFIKLYKKYIVF